MSIVASVGRMLLRVHVRSTPRSLTVGRIPRHLGIRALSTELSKEAVAEKLPVDSSLRNLAASQSHELSDLVEQIESGSNLSPSYISIVKSKIRELCEDNYDVNLARTITRCLYRPTPTLDQIMKREDIWIDLLKLGIVMAEKGHPAELEHVVSSARKSFAEGVNSDLDILTIKAYGILNKPNGVSNTLQKITQVDDQTKSAAILAYIKCDRLDHAEDLLQPLLTSGNLDKKHLLKKVVKEASYKGHINFVKKYSPLYLEAAGDAIDVNVKTLELNAYKCALERIHAAKIFKQPYFANYNLEEINSSWKSLVKTISHPTTQQCNIMLSYYATANRIDPNSFSIKLAEDIVNNYMPQMEKHPNHFTFSTLMYGYATSQELTENSRLDNALKVAEELKARNIGLSRHDYAALLRACIPHKGSFFPFDNLTNGATSLSDNLRSGTFTLDPRFFDIEKEMLSKGKAHDRKSIMIALTCLGAAGQWKEFWRRWDALGTAGLKRDGGLYQRVFTMAALDKDQAKVAVTSIKAQLLKEIPARKLKWNLLCSMLDCCITAQNALVAQQIIGSLRTHAHPPKRPFDYYIPILKAYVSIKELRPEAHNLLAEMREKDIAFVRPIWYHALRLYALEKRTSAEIQRLFTEYASANFIHTSRLAIPIGQDEKLAFPAGPYTRQESQMIEIFIGSLIDSQDIAALQEVKEILEEDGSPYVQNHIERIRSFLDGQPVK